VLHEKSDCKCRSQLLLGVGTRTKRDKLEHLQCESISPLLRQLMGYEIAFQRSASRSATSTSATQSFGQFVVPPPTDGLALPSRPVAAADLLRQPSDGPFL
jgi:hypothetical protein